MMERDEVVARADQICARAWANGSVIWLPGEVTVGQIKAKIEALGEYASMTVYQKGWTGNDARVLALAFEEARKTLQRTAIIMEPVDLGPDCPF